MYRREPCDERNDTCQSMPETDRMAGSIRIVEHEFEAFEGNRLGIIECFDNKGRYHPRCWLRRGPNDK